MTETLDTASRATTPVVIDSHAVLAHWQGHRRLTRHTIDAFQEKDLFEFSVGGMRPFAALAVELIDIAGSGVTGVATREWRLLRDHTGGLKPASKAALLAEWDETTAVIEERWKQIPDGRFGEEDIAFGQYPGRVSEFLLYFVDNEIHHRGQGYVYLRALGVTPPGFYERE